MAGSRISFINLTDRTWSNEVFFLFYKIQQIFSVSMAIIL